jgi:hypothetical protein
MDSTFGLFNSALALHAQGRSQHGRALPRRWLQSAHDPIHGSPLFEFRPRRLSLGEAWLLRRGPFSRAQLGRTRLPRLLDALGTPGFDCADTAVNTAEAQKSSIRHRLLPWGPDGR